MANPVNQFNRCMWFANVAGWPNGASPEATERCFDRAFGRTENMPTGGTVSNQLIAQRATPMAIDYDESDGSLLRWQTYAATGRGYRTAPKQNGTTAPMWPKVVAVAIIAFIIYKVAK